MRSRARHPIQMTLRNISPRREGLILHPGHPRIKRAGKLAVVSNRGDLLRAFTDGCLVFVAQLSDLHLDLLVLSDADWVRIHLAGLRVDLCRRLNQPLPLPLKPGQGGGELLKGICHVPGAGAHPSSALDSWGKRRVEEVLVRGLVTGRQTPPGL